MMPQRPAHLPLAVPTAAAHVLEALQPYTADGLRPLYVPTPRQVALAEYLAACVRECRARK